VGTYTYHASKKHQLASTSNGWSFAHDANGNMTSGRGATVTWTSYNYPATIANGTDTAAFSYTPDRQYWKQISNYTSGGAATTIYVGGILEKVTAGGFTDFRHMIRAGGSKIIVSRSTSGTNSVHYVTSDHLGSNSAVTNSSGSMLVNSSFDAFGKRRGSNWTGNPSAVDWTAIASTTRRGYTDHTMLDNLKLIHMNGRVQDPVLGRFLSADPYVPHPFSTQSYNRYSYVQNNPLTYADPSGFKEKEWKSAAELGEPKKPGSFPPAKCNGSLSFFNCAGFMQDECANAGCVLANPYLGGGQAESVAAALEAAEKYGTVVAEVLMPHTVYYSSLDPNIERTWIDNTNGVVLGIFNMAGAQFQIGPKEARGAAGVEILASVLPFLRAMRAESYATGARRMFALAGDANLGSNAARSGNNVIRVVEPGKPQFQLRQGEQGLSVFDANKVSPSDVLPHFREGSQTVVRSVDEIRACGLSVVCTPGDASLPKFLRDAHMEIRPGEEMTRNEFKKALKLLESGP
jgi:RHS repeat-associated protein